QASLELEQQQVQSLQQEARSRLQQELNGVRAAVSLLEKQRQEQGRRAAESMASVLRLEKELEKEREMVSRRSDASKAPTNQIQQVLSSKLLEKQTHLEEIICERATLSAKLREVTSRATRAEQELGDIRGDNLEAGGGGG
ncbi:unnamed protein product, partial [Choristocarpus tenellus]